MTRKVKNAMAKINLAEGQNESATFFALKKLIGMSEQQAQVYMSQMQNPNRWNVENEGRSDD
jgi:hypothetical protein